MKKAFILSGILILCLSAIAQVGQITHVNVNQRTDGSGLVDIYFDLNCLGGSSYSIAFEASFNGGEDFVPITQEFIEGSLNDLGPGEGYHYIWDGLASHPGIYTEEARVKLIATLIEQGDAGGTVTDIDGNVYRTVIIGNQEWTGTNLKVTKYRNGDSIASDLTNAQWANLTTGAVSFFQDQNLARAYGGHYNWYAVTDPRGICPLGWEVPGQEDWSELLDFLIDNFEDIDNSNVGDKLKSCRQVNSPLGGDCLTSRHPRWNSGGVAYGTDDFGFSGIPGGMRLNSGGYAQPGTYGYYWTTNELSETTAALRRFGYASNQLLPSEYTKTGGLSVRCVRPLQTNQ